MIKFIYILTKENMKIKKKLNYYYRIDIFINYKYVINNIYNDNI